MKRTALFLTAILLLFSVAQSAGAEYITQGEGQNMNMEAAAQDTWRSSLYPADWYPGYQDASGRFLQDYSYAGYYKGEAEIPTNLLGTIFNVIASPYNADNTGLTDTTAAIQHAIDDAQAAGGGVVYLPSGNLYGKTCERKQRGSACFMQQRGDKRGWNGFHPYF